MKKVALLLNTVRYLTLQQIVYRVYYGVRNKYRNPIDGQRNDFCIDLKLLDSIFSKIIYQNKKFKFLNKQEEFKNSIDWNLSKNGKLWLYNLNYFDFLEQKNISKEEGVYLINDFISKSSDIKDGMMPFPISLRGVNWIKFLVKYNIVDEKINTSLYSQYYILLDNLEYHIMGNHLLENGFSLLFGAYYFDDKTLHAKAKAILTQELNEQVLADGAHFELSPMYHQIMLFRVLDCINLLQNNMKEEDSYLLNMFKTKAALMLGWLQNITFENGSIPHLNDSTAGIAPSSKQLMEYAQRLKITPKVVPLGESGYRKFQFKSYECVIDVGNIGPDYIPGHAHADTFNFVLYVDNLPFIVDTGLSTYETNERRMLERSTSSHNTVEIDGLNQSEVWGGFRVAKRAKITNIKEKANVVEATHDGYKRTGALHTRKFSFDERKVYIEDFIESKDTHECSSYLHLYPELEPNVKNNEIVINNVTIKLENYVNIRVEKYLYAKEFNTLVEAKRIKIDFIKELKMGIEL